MPDLGHPFSFSDSATQGRAAPGRRYAAITPAVRANIARRRLALENQAALSGADAWVTRAVSGSGAARAESPNPSFTGAWSGRPPRPAAVYATLRA